jgi:hypothetical protein
MSGAKMIDAQSLPADFSKIVMDTLSLKTAFGLRFSDAGSGRPLTAAPPRVRLMHGTRLMEATQNGGGAMVAHLLPGPRDRTRILVTDPAGRFLGFSFAATAPSAKGWMLPACVTGPFLPLMPSPTAPLSGTEATLRVTLLEAAQRPARCAVLSLFEGTQLLAQSFADENGRVLLVLPWPEPQPGVLAGQSWTRRLELRWRAGFAAEQPRDPAEPSILLPDLCDLLRQPLAQLRMADGTTVTEATLRHGKPTELSTLFVHP